MGKMLLIPVLAMAVAGGALGLGSNHPDDRPVSLWDAPAGLNDLINSHPRVHGYFVNAEDRFFYPGDPSAFARFLEQYARLRAIAGHRLTIHQGTGSASSPWDVQCRPCDWMLEVARVPWREIDGREVFRSANASSSATDVEYLAEVHVWTEAAIDIQSLKVSADVHVVHRVKPDDQADKTRDD